MEGREGNLGTPSENVDVFRVDNFLKSVKETGLKKRIRGEFEVMKNFEGVYSVAEIRSDMAKVIEMENYFFKKHSDLGTNKLGEKGGDVLELLIERVAEQNEWFGEGSYISGTILYDDWMNGVDMVLEFDSGDDDLGKVALAIDCTSDQHRISEKLENNKKAFLTIGGRSVKYFEAQIPEVDYKGGIFCAPFIIGVGQETTDNVLENCRNLKMMAEHPIQFAFLLEIQSQVDMYLNLLNGTKSPVNGQVDFSELNREVNRVSKIITRVIAEKSKLMTKNAEKCLLCDYIFRLMTGLAERGTS